MQLWKKMQRQQTRTHLWVPIFFVTACCQMNISSDQRIKQQANASRKKRKRLRRRSDRDESRRRLVRIVAAAFLNNSEQIRLPFTALSNSFPPASIDWDFKKFSGLKK